MAGARFGGVELGGTKALALISDGATILDQCRLPTTAPDRLLPPLAAWLAARHAEHPLASLGIASFGPLRLDPAAADFGHMLPTPKPGWSDADIRGGLAGWFDGPVALDTDVNGAALAEGQWGAARGCAVHAYLTIGTGLGGGIVVNGAPLHGLLHPELGHVRVSRPAGASFKGICPFHGDCLEGLIAGPALAARTGLPGEALPPDHPVWAEVCDELADLLATLLLTVSAQRILIGGGVGLALGSRMKRLRAAVADRLGGYLPGIDASSLETIIMPPALGDRAGPLGAIALAKRVFTAETFG
ncbi:ROK family protein [Sandaracinobacteroides saxicola]|uniref:fructokinase n=1 Tax=Sandaracinobacteroides saxicola TaxID=2759707 RepID=A0A7G5IGS3_9SPHN|nr:ROK family protein [Sandaracinobacteroides saxicola]QMW22565.1 ROK family protein [Sandaracinobacteroides saxicola]